VIEVLSRDYVENKTPTARIDPEICSENNCRICVASCPYGALQVKEEHVTVNEEVCMGCGICTATCAAGANQLEGYEEKGMLAQIGAMTKEGRCSGVFYASGVHTTPQTRQDMSG